MTIKYDRDGIIIFITCQGLTWVTGLVDVSLLLNSSHYYTRNDVVILSSYKNLLYLV